MILRYFAGHTPAHSSIPDYFNLLPLFFLDVGTHFSRKYIIAYGLIAHHIAKTAIKNKHRPLLARDDTIQSAKQTNAFSN
jgi:hypothetical protein